MAQAQSTLNYFLISSDILLADICTHCFKHKQLEYYQLELHDTNCFPFKNFLEQEEIKLQSEKCGRKFVGKR